MPIKKWHYGKLIILWAWTALLVGLFLQGLESLSDAPGSTWPKFALIVSMGTLLVAMSMITWKWLTGKQRE